ncbi:hypothetical protein GTX14_16075 [Streptomyces sp. SID4944]|nr:hypothetical protein [Streptomyces sp. SID4944]
MRGTVRHRGTRPGRHELHLHEARLPQDQRQLRYLRWPVVGVEGARRHGPVGQHQGAGQGDPVPPEVHAQGRSRRHGRTLGPRTRAAVVKYQSSARLPADGIVGPQTWRSLRVGGYYVP